MKQLFTLALVVTIAFSNNLNAQGCSDAGFCSIGNLAHHNMSDAKAVGKRSLKISLPIGTGDDDVVVFNPGIEYTQLTGRWQLQGKVTANYASGNLGKAFGPGDVFLSGTYFVPTQKKWKTSLTLGTKLPLNQGNLKEGGRSLPMQYQSSLGTIDLITGVSVSSDRWQFATGWQQPLSGINRNNFLPVYWSDPAAKNYPPTNDFKRKGDVLLRSTYGLVKKPKSSLDVGLLGIYHLGEDTYIDANESPRPIPIRNSAGLTLNATAAYNVSLNSKWGIGILGGLPLVIRDVRPDGLTRSFVIAPTIHYNF